MKINSYCFQKNNIWYFKKRIPNLLNTKNLIYKVSLKKLLGKKSYYNSLLTGTIFSITNYLNNNIELFFLEVENLSLEELNGFVISLLNKYEENAVMRENCYINNINSRKEEIEDKRFESLAFFDENGKKIGGHTKKALDREREELLEAFDTENIQLIRKKAKDILLRQDILTKEEISKIPDELILDFEKNLVKKELEVINQDIDNYSKLTKKDDNSINSFLEQYPFLDDILKDFKQKSDSSDNWKLLIDKYIDSKQKNGRNTRTAEIALKQFSQIMMGNSDLNVPKRNIVDCRLDDINELKEIYKELPKLSKAILKEKNQIDGILYTIEFSKRDREEYPKSLLGGLKVKIKIILEFLKDIKLYEPQKYGNLNIDLWQKLHIKFNELSKEDQAYNKENEKQFLDSKYINEFLLNRYLEKYEEIVGQAKRNFTRHTTASPHIFWSLALGLFTGARAEELAQLRLRDFKKVVIENETIYYINLQITDPKKQSLKNLASERFIPISNYLIDWGFLNYVQEKIEEEADYLFDLTINKDGKRNGFQKNFNEDIKLFIKKFHPEYEGKLPSFHDFRSHFISRFLNDKSDDMNKLVEIKKLVGHTKKDLHKDVTISTYFREPLDIQYAKNLIDNIDFKIEEGYRFIKEMMNERYNNEILRDLKI